MLKQILQNMRIEPEILNGLTDQEKQTLFCIMREEQVKRWSDWDIQKTEAERNQQNSTDSLNNEDTYNNVNLSQLSTKRSKKLKKYSVDFLLGADGEPWVWVMGEHENDRTIEEILGEEAQRKARELAEQEAKELRKSVEAELTDIIEYNNNGHNTAKMVEEPTKRPVKKLDDEGHTPIIDDLEIYCSVDELRDRMSEGGGQKKTQQSQHAINNIQNNNINGKHHLLSHNRIVKTNHVLQEISNNKPVAKNTQKVAARVALWEQRLIAERSTEILRGIQKKQEEKAKEAEEAAKSCDHLWKEQERRAKEAESKMRDIARRAREEHRKSLNCDQWEAVEEKQKQEQQTRRTVILEKSPSSSPPTSLDGSVPRPPNPEAVLRWYRDTELAKGTGREINGVGPAKWFHGLLSRAEAEALLANRTQGSFLVRISEKIWGYAISFKDEDRCKHYLVDASSGHYQFLGSNQITHRSLEELLRAHATTPITTTGNELLKVPVVNYRPWEEILARK